MAGIVQVAGDKMKNRLSSQRKAHYTRAIKAQNTMSVAMQGVCIRPAGPREGQVGRGLVRFLRTSMNQAKSRKEERWKQRLLFKKAKGPV